MTLYKSKSDNLSQMEQLFLAHEMTYYWRGISIKIMLREPNNPASISETLGRRNNSCEEPGKKG